jgi:hypothetical protein
MNQIAATAEEQLARAKRGRTAEPLAERARRRIVEAVRNDPDYEDGLFTRFLERLQSQYTLRKRRART